VESILKAKKQEVWGKRSKWLEVWFFIERDKNSLYANPMQMIPLLVGSVTVHNVKGGRSSPVHWPFNGQRAYSSQSQALNHVGGLPHLLPRGLPFSSATKPPNCTSCYSVTETGRMEGWVGLVGWL